MHALWPRFVVLIGTGALAMGQSSTPQSTTPQFTAVVLSAESSKSLRLTPFGGFGNSQCDRKGNLYFHASRTDDESLVLRIGPDGAYDVYSLSGQDASDKYFLAFRVDPDGKLWMLDQGNKGGLFVIGFKDTDSSPVKIQLDVPDHLEARNFVVLQNGEIVLSGLFNQEASKDRQGQSFVGRFDAQGRALNKSLGDKTSSEDFAELMKLGADAAAGQAEDGLIYLLQGNQILVISQTGEVTKKLKVGVPEEGFRPYNLYVAGGRISVSFAKVSENPRGKIIAMYALLDRSTGDQLRLYKPSPELGNHMVCFSDDGFAFLGMDKAGLKLIRARAD